MKVGMERKGASEEMQPKVDHGSSSRNARSGWGIKSDAKDIDRSARRSEERELIRRAMLGEYETDEEDVATIIANLAEDDDFEGDIEEDIAAWMK